jgi:hypothetical protein
MTDATCVPSAPKESTRGKGRQRQQSAFLPRARRAVLFMRTLLARLSFYSFGRGRNVAVRKFRLAPPDLRRQRKVGDSDHGNSRILCDGSNPLIVRIDHACLCDPRDRHDLPVVLHLRPSLLRARFFVSPADRRPRHCRNLDCGKSIERSNVKHSRRVISSTIRGASDGSARTSTSPRAGVGTMSLVLDFSNVSMRKSILSLTCVTGCPVLESIGRPDSGRKRSNNNVASITTIRCLAMPKGQ